MYLNDDGNVDDDVPGSNEASDEESTHSTSTGDNSEDNEQSILDTEIKEAEAIPGGTLRSGKTFRDIAAANIAAHPIKITTAEVDYLLAMKELGELACVGAGIGGGFEHTSELHVLKYNQAMAGPDSDKWTKAVEEEHTRMIDNEVWKPVPSNQVPKDAKVLTSTWAMKKKSDGTYRARLNARGYEQEPNVHYDPKSIAAPVVAFITIRIAFTLMLMAMHYGYLLDVKGAFLKGKLQPDEKMYMKVPQGMTHHYPENTVLLMMKTIY
jgi:hypothetical protein